MGEEISLPSPLRRNLQRSQPAVYQLHLVLDLRFSKIPINFKKEGEKNWGSQFERTLDIPSCPSCPAMTNQALTKEIGTGVGNWVT